MDRATLELAFAQRARVADAAPGTVLVTRRHSGPLRVQKALYPEGEVICHAVIVHPPGGIVGGDQLKIDAHMGVGTHAFLTTPGATKWYRAEGEAQSIQATHLRVGEGAACEWLPQESIYFDGVNARTEMEVTLGAGARFIAQEITCLGRRSSGERFARGALCQRICVRVGGRPVFVEQGRIDAASALMQSPVGLNGCTVTGMLVAVGSLGKSAQSVLDACRAALAQASGAELARVDQGVARVGVTRLAPLAAPGTDVVLVRYLGQSSEQARIALLCAWQVLRPAILNVPAAVPRIWNT